VNRKIRQLAAGLMALFVLLFVAMNYWQVGRASEVNGMADNTRALRREFGQPRGEIITADGAVVARSVPTPDGSAFPLMRDYPTGPLFADVTGYYSFAFGSTQLEFTENDVLTGQTGRQIVGNLQDVITGGDGTGDVLLTMRNDLQDKARDLLDGQPGAIVMLDMQGGVLAMYGNPTYDPNNVVSLDFGLAQSTLESLNADPDQPLLANAYQQRYMPGSTFKVITTAVGLDAGVIDLDSQFERTTSWTPPQTNNPIENYNGTNCGGDLTEVFRRSCNIPFAQTSLNIGVDGMISGTDRWGVGQPIPIDLPRPAASTFGNTDNLDQQLPLLAMRGFGQQEVQMVPLHMAMVAQTVARGGTMMKPYVVAGTTDSQGQVLSSTEPEVWLTPTSPQTAATLNALMQQVAVNGTASCCIALDNGISVAAKTGTAQLNEAGQPELSNAWIIAFAPADHPQYAIAVMLNDVDAEISAVTGGRVAGPLAREMLNYAFEVGA